MPLITRLPKQVLEHPFRTPC